MTLDPILLSRIQWAWVIGWHILLPAFTVGLASYIAVLEGLFFTTGDAAWYRISRFWTRIFSVSFGMGVVSGIIMPFQFGTNWSRFSDATANILSPMLAYEDLMAFFLEATFLGVLLFGRHLVPRWAHLLAACMVALGTLMSSFWILSVNSWMQTPAGFTFHDGRFFPTDWGAIVFNPPSPIASRIMWWPFTSPRDLSCSAWEHGCCVAPTSQRTGGAFCAWRWVFWPSSCPCRSHWAICTA
jgi:cytochrome d ubiquinol oxidase subunit I